MGFLLPSDYFELRGFERSGIFYRRMGVRKIRYFGGNGDGIQRLAQWVCPEWKNPYRAMPVAKWIRQTILDEQFHWGLMIASLPVAAWAFYTGFARFGVVLLVINVPFHIYPILLQRYIRAQLTRIGDFKAGY
jgi:hypothetical protein